MGRTQGSHLHTWLLRSVFLRLEGEEMLAKDLKMDEKKRREMTESIINRQYQGEVYILTPGKIWKTLVLKHFNKVKRGDMSLDELISFLVFMAS